jgi:hypothetical protein
MFGLGDIFDPNAIDNSMPGHGGVQISRAACIAAINHQNPLDIGQQMSCAQQGYSGNAAWPKPSPMPRPIEATQHAIMQSQNPVTSLPLINQVPQTLPVTQYPDPSPAVGGTNCSGVNDWISKNPGIALVLLIGIYALKGGK